MATAEQTRAARRNVTKAREAATSKKTIAPHAEEDPDVTTRPQARRELAPDRAGRIQAAGKPGRWPPPGSPAASTIIEEGS